MGIPAGPPLHAKTAHGLIAANYVLESAGFDVVDPWPVIGRGRPLIEHKFALFGGASDRFLENRILFPKFQSLPFFLAEIALHMPKL